MCVLYEWASEREDVCIGNGQGLCVCNCIVDVCVFVCMCVCLLVCVVAEILLLLLFSLPCHESRQPVVT